ncbi:hypothetical protein [Litorihabitans aurantiacus]|uniref:Uncharacterized protein n=1 Tax=Litorihabitans aurantiacus TaxID=1930061 RepID=A0AA37XFA7_9MICO|nr:hypothetical protein [Litorihabitans aurantiacus]GMA32044.1 hypothetical protein GCM10025875_20360 [Litorihabitans aurantiacus]
MAASGIADAAVQGATATVESEAGYDVVIVELTAPVPVIGPLGPSGTLVVRGRAVVEQ